jgi:hypothetical protein
MVDKTFTSRDRDEYKHNYERKLEVEHKEAEEEHLKLMQFIEKDKKIKKQK